MGGNPNGARGARWEKSCVEYLIPNGFPECERRHVEGTNDRGDLVLPPGLVIECKDEQRINLPEYMRELAVEMANADAAYGWAFVKNRRHGTAAGYAVQPIEQAVAIMRRLTGRDV